MVTETIEERETVWTRRPQGAAAIAASAKVQAQPVATLSGVTKRYGPVVALDDLSLALRPGEIVALLGPNGAGKSTAVRMLLGLIAPTSGAARVFGMDPREQQARMRIGAMLQVARIPETMKVREHIDLFRSYYPAPLPVAEIVRIAQLEGIEERLFGKLSGGQKQRVLFGLAVCGDPDLVFLDEPTVGMDIEARRGLWQQIRSLAARGKTVLLTTHYLEEADALAHRIIVVNKGRVVSEGTPAQVKSGIAGRTVRCRTALSLDTLRAMPGVASVECDGGKVTVTTAEAEQVVREMLLRDATLSELEIASPALEDAFLALTKDAR
jgi:ABC-2 type transport system ATP-binding protein